MSFVRWGSCGSNVYAYESGDGQFICSGCSEHKSPRGLAWHIFSKHHIRGQKVPLFAYFNILGLPLADKVQDAERYIFNKMKK